MSRLSGRSLDMGGSPDMGGVYRSPDMGGVYLT